MKSKTNRTSKSTCDQPSAKRAARVQDQPSAKRAARVQDQIERIKLDLLSLVSHELRTPLTGVLNAIRVLREGDISVSERFKFLDMAQRNAERLNATLGQLLDLSKLVSGRLVCRFHEVSLKQLMLGQLEKMSSEAELLGYVLEVDGEADDLPVILGDAPRLDQVASSLIDNALKFAPAASTIAVKMRVGSLPNKSEGVFIELTNPIKKGSLTGKEDLFKIFSQPEGVLNRAHEGVGGSLALGAEVLRQHGGSLSAKVEAQKFIATVVLPVLKSEQALLKVLESRLYALKTEVGALSLMILEVPRKSVTVTEALKAALFRASDTVYGLGDAGQIAVVMDDCKKVDAPKIIRRLIENMGAEAGKFLKPARVGLVAFPEDGTDPQKLLAKARKSLVPLAEF